MMLLQRPFSSWCRLREGRNNTYRIDYKSVIAIWGIVKIMVPFWVPIISYYNTGSNLGDPKRDHNFDNPPYTTMRVKPMALYIRVLQECCGYETDITLRATAGHFSPAASPCFATGDSSTCCRRCCYRAS